MHQRVRRRGSRKAKLCDVRADWLGWAEPLRGQLYCCEIQCSWRSFLQLGVQDDFLQTHMKGEGKQ